MFKCMQQRNIHILIVDDNKFYRQALVLTLRRLFQYCKIDETCSAKESLCYIHQEIPDLVFMDIKMPEMDGITATRKVLEINDSIKIIALSMYDNSKYKNDMILAGAKGFLLKNFETNELREAIETVIHGGKYFSAKPSRNSSSKRWKM
ncbi:response regulator transcription factor [Labilibacter sediminis]|nr:response regulator transcription factor [Labilibacter sediminis]